MNREKSQYSKEFLIELYRTLYKIRVFETKGIALYRQGYILLSAQMKSDFLRFTGVLSSADTVSYVTPSLVSIFLVRNCHDVDLPKYAGNVHLLALIV